MREKRRTLKLLLGAGTANDVLPKTWTKPMLNSIILLVHTQTSTDDSNCEITLGNDYTINKGGRALD